MVQLAEPIITPAPRPTSLGRQYVQFRPRQTASDSNLGVGASAGVSGDGSGDAGISAGSSTTDTGDTTASGQASATSGDGSSSQSQNGSTSSNSSPTSSPDSTPPTSAPPSSTSPTSTSSSTTSSQSSTSPDSSSLSPSQSSSSTSSSDSDSSSPSQTSPSSTSSSQSNTSISSSSTLTSTASSESSSSIQSSITFVTVVTTEPDGSVSTFVVPSSLSSQSPDSKSANTHTAIIAGSAVGGALFAILLAVLVSLFCWRRRKNRKLGFIEALTRRSKEGKGAGGVGLLDGEFDDDEEYRDELAGVHMRERTTSAHSPQPSVGAGSMASLSGPTQNSQHANYPYNPAPTLYRARASDSGSMFHEEGVWPPPNHGTQFVDPFVPARELSKDSELGSIVDQVMGTDISAHASSLPPGAAPAVVPGAVGVPDSSSHVRGASGSSVNSTTPKRSSPLSKMLSKPDPPRSILTRTQTDPNASFDAHNNSTMVSSPTSIHPRNWLERQPKTPSPRDPPLTLPPPLNLSGSSAPPSAFANSASSLVNAYGAPHMTSPPTSAGTSKHNKRVSWGELPTPSRPGSRTGSIAGGIGEAM
ncbi:hypothetical protein C8J55DRAFT_562167 [Lentinula edodes]|uniref:REJ domain-containing protein n=1 Tax=Lentinula lateritia TaxID=40482 RepID=A0A9W9A5S4_9AGAR|nr:hypothetical protein C8J55DRAFT_562167 [Lentinula edodes]